MAICDLRDDPKSGILTVASGLSVCASDDVPADATIVSCPFSLAITPELAKHALSSLLKSPAAIEKWAAKQLIATYLCLHWIVGSDQQELPPVLAHLLYLDILPGPDKLRTPLHFTSSELDAFKGTNLYGAVDTRRQEWQEEWQACRSVVEEHDKSMSADFTWSVRTSFDRDHTEYLYQGTISHGRHIRVFAGFSIHHSLCEPISSINR